MVEGVTDSDKELELKNGSKRQWSTTWYQGEEKIEDGEEIKDGAKIIWASVIPNRKQDHPRELRKNRV